LSSGSRVLVVVNDYCYLSIALDILVVSNQSFVGTDCNALLNLSVVNFKTSLDGATVTAGS
jgi:hypothetical protein